MKNWMTHIVYIIIVSLVGFLAVMTNRSLDKITTSYTKLAAAQSQCKQHLLSTKSKVKLAVDLKKRSKDNFQIVVWSNVAAIRAYSFSFMNYKQEFNSISQYFMPNSWSKFKQALNSSNIMKLVLAEKMVVGAVAQGPATITKQGVVGGRYQWDVLLPMQLTLSNGLKTLRQKLLVAMTVIRTDAPDGKSGLAILNFNTTNNVLKK